MVNRATLFFLLVSLLIILVGCIGYGQIIRHVSAEEEKQLQQIKLIESENIEAKSYKIIKKVKGLSCTEHMTGVPPTRSKAVRQAKIYAMRAGGNAITNLVCVINHGQDLKNNCNGSIECFADAIQVD